MELIIRKEMHDEKRYSLSIKNDIYWIRNEEGDGIGMNGQQLFDYPDEWFKENH